jgi:hypothetical protein
VRARQALVLPTFLAGDYATSKALETANLEVFRARRSRLQVADSLTLLAGATWKLGEPVAAWGRIQEALPLFAEIDSASGLARVLGMGSLVQLIDGDPDVGARLAGATYRLVREKGVMLAPVKVLHLPDPAEVATGRLGAERAAALMAEGDAMSMAEVLEVVAKAPLPGSRAADPGSGV